jgi:Putative prokaryotic signal transducing protein
MPDLSPVTIAECPTEAEAAITMAVLGSYGIDAVVSRDDAGGMQPGLSYISGVKVLVAAEDAAEARRVLAENATDQ